MDEKIVGIIRGMIRRWAGEPITPEKLVALRNEVYKKTRTNKNAPFSNVKKWIKEARKQIRAEEKKKGKSAAKPAKRHVHEEEEIHAPKVPESLQRSIDAIKEESHEIYVERPAPKIVFDKVYLQNIQYDISGMRSALERMSRQLEKLEKELNEHG